MFSVLSKLCFFHLFLIDNLTTQGRNFVCKTFISNMKLFKLERFFLDLASVFKWILLKFVFKNFILLAYSIIFRCRLFNRLFSSLDLVHNWYVLFGQIFNQLFIKFQSFLHFFQLILQFLLSTFPVLKQDFDVLKFVLDLWLIVFCSLKNFSLVIHLFLSFFKFWGQFRAGESFILIFFLSIKMEFLSLLKSLFQLKICFFYSEDLGL